jgi:TPR repeat protein
MYFTGRGVPRDDQQAALWFLAAAEQGIPEAQNNLAVLFYRGEGVPVDYRRAAYWAQRGADQGYAPAQADLAYLYEQGKGVSLDYAKAYMWYSRAAASGDKKAVSRLKPLIQLMGPQQVREAQAQASAWTSHPEKIGRPSESGHTTATSFLPNYQVSRDY